jgi:hypothetical protein
MGSGWIDKHDGANIRAFTPVFAGYAGVLQDPRTQVHRARLQLVLHRATPWPWPAGSQQTASNCAAGARIWRDDVNAKGGFQCPPAGRCHRDRRPRMRRHISSAVPVTFRNYVSTTLLTSRSGRARWFASLLMRGVSGDDPEGGAGEWRPAAAARNRSLGRFGKSARQALRPGCEELRCTDREAMPEMEARNPDLKSPWWSAERRASRVMGRRGASQAPRPAA